MKTLWIARDKCGGLYLYNDEPIKDNNFGVFQADNNYDEIEINPELFPEITFENSPKQVELKLIKKMENKDDSIFKLIMILIILLLLIIIPILYFIIKVLAVMKFLIN